MTNIEVIGLGALNTDNIYKVERILEDGEAMVEWSGLFPGGSAANTIYGLAKLGVKTGFTGVIGDDAEGKLLLEDFQKVGVDISQVRIKPQAKTGTALCLSDKLNFRSIYITPGANNRLTMDDLDLDYINQARMLHLSSFADEQQFQVILKLIERLGLSPKLSFAPGALHASKELTALAPILAKTHVLFVNQKEIQQLTGENITAGAETCLKKGCRIVVVTLGKGKELKVGKGSSRRKVTAVAYIRDTEQEYVIQAGRQITVSAVDTIGAGDAFATGFLYGLVKGKGLDECGRLGDIVAKLCITKLGAREGLPTLDELTQRYKELYSK